MECITEVWSGWVTRVDCVHIMKKWVLVKEVELSLTLMKQNKDE